MSIDIAVTGMGLTTSLGRGLALNWERLARGESGIAPLRRLAVGDYPVRDGGEGPEAPDLRDTTPELRHLVAVCEEALAAAGAGALGADPDRVGLTVGSSLAASSAANAFFVSLLEAGPEGACYEALRGYYVDGQLDELGRRLDVRGPSLLVSNACAAGASAIARAADWLRAGRCDAVIATGFDAFSVFTFAGFGSLMALSRETTRPFAAQRDGMKLGGGWAALVLEPRRRAAARGARVLATLSGWGESSDAHHLTHPHPRGLGAALAMRRALDVAGLTPDAIDAINCHGTATPSNDAAETAAMREVFGERLASMPICASKPAVGHTLGGAGAVEAVIGVQCLVEQLLPPTVNAGAIDEALAPLDLVAEPRRTTLRHLMSNSFGFGGANASLVLSRENGGTP